MLRADYQKLLERIRNLPPQSPPRLASPPSTTRTQRLRKRRKLGLRAFTVLACEEALDALVKLEFLNQDDRNSQAAVQIALARFLYRQLVEYYQYTPWAIAQRNAREQPFNRPIHGKPNKIISYKQPANPSQSANEKTLPLASGTRHLAAGSQTRALWITELGCRAETTKP
jgi:hypothetical protein